MSPARRESGGSAELIIVRIENAPFRKSIVLSIAGARLPNRLRRNRREARLTDALTACV